jgi:Ca2+/Na+ antiporter
LTFSSVSSVVSGSAKMKSYLFFLCFYPLLLVTKIYKAVGNVCVDFILKTYKWPDLLLNLLSVLLNSLIKSKKTSAVTVISYAFFAISILASIASMGSSIRDDMSITMFLHCCKGAIALFIFYIINMTSHISAGDWVYTICCACSYIWLFRYFVSEEDRDKYAENLEVTRRELKSKLEQVSFVDS